MNESKKREIFREIVIKIQDDGIISALDNFKGIPYNDLFREEEEDLEHIRKVVEAMNNLINNKFNELLNLSGHDDRVSQKSGGYYKILEELICNLTEEDKDLLLCASLYHDIGKSMIRPRHGPEGADIIKDSGLDVRREFCRLGFERRDLYFISDLIRFHDYLAMVGTGEVSYLIFSEVLSTISNISISQPNSSERYIDFLFLLNLADLAGSVGKLGGEDFTILIHDYKNIKCIQKTMLIDGVHPYGNYKGILARLKILSEDHTHERLRRLLRTGFRKALKYGLDKNKLNDYIKWADAYEDCLYSEDDTSRKKARPFSSWFSRDYGVGINDVIPINSSLRGINIKPEFYIKFSFICKLDYFLYFLERLICKIIEIEIEKENMERKNPHDLRRDLSMTLVEIINILIESYGDLTLNDTKIGIGFERFKQMHNPNKMLTRLTGARGQFKEAEAYTKFRNMIVLWTIN
jgi:hypothetical protein